MRHVFRIFPFPIPTNTILYTINIEIAYVASSQILALIFITIMSFGNNAGTILVAHPFAMEFRGVLESDLKMVGSNFTIRKV